MAGQVLLREARGPVTHFMVCAQPRSAKGWQLFVSVQSCAQGEDPGAPVATRHDDKQSGGGRSSAQTQVGNRENKSKGRRKAVGGKSSGAAEQPHTQHTHTHSWNERTNSHVHDLYTV